MAHTKYIIIQNVRVWLEENTAVLNILRSALILIYHLISYAFLFENFNKFHSGLPTKISKPGKLL